MRTIFLGIFSLILGFSPLNLQAWGPTGHRVIAEIAQRNLNRKANKQVTKLLDNYPMAYWSVWADNIKSDTTDRWTHTHIWHYVNIPGDLQKQEMEQAVNDVKQANVYSEIQLLCDVIKNKNTATDEKREALYFLIHLVGDLHQPMHIGREADLGGNKITVYWFGTPTNIHAVWDSNLINNERYSYTEYTAILNRISSKEKKEIQKGTAMDWLFDTYQITNEIYSSVKNEDKLSYAYPYKYKSTVELQLQRAGLRLAAILNQLF